MQISKVVEDGITIFTVTGAVGAEEIVTQAVENMAAAQTRHSLWDFSGASGVNLTAGAMEQIACRLQPHATGIRGGRVALVGSQQINIGLGKVFKVFATIARLPFDYRVFRSAARARDWLLAP